jgi:DNA-binding transcriptional MerR regulator
MKIGELASRAGTTPKTLRFYEQQGLLPRAPRTTAGYREFTPDTLSRLDFIHRGQAAGLTLAKIKEVLDIRDAGRAPCGHVRDLLAQRLHDIDTQLRTLAALRDTLAELYDDAEDAQPETCKPDQICHYL